MEKPNCYECIHRRPFPGDAHSMCANRGATVRAERHGIEKGWFLWPFNFDPVWLLECDGFTPLTPEAKTVSLPSKPKEDPEQGDLEP